MKTPLVIICCFSVLLFSPAQSKAVPTLPDFDAATFTPAAPVDNIYFPMLDSTTRVFEGQIEEDGEVSTERFELTNLGPGPVILGVQTTIQRDRAFEDGVLVEDTFDYYAQDTAGNVWYFGEDVTNYVYDDEGNLVDINNESAWLAGVNDALPGIIMPAILNIGEQYYQEFAPNDDALDTGTIYSLDNFIDLAIGGFDNVLQILEGTELDPDVAEFKYYGPGIGLLLVEEDLDESLANPALSVEFIGTIPEPSVLSLAVVGLVALKYRQKPEKNS